MGIFDRLKKGKQGNPGVNGGAGSSELTLEQAEPVTKSIAAKLGYPCRIFSRKARYEEIMEAYEQAVREGRQEGYTPVLVPRDEVLDEYLGILKDDGYSLESILGGETESGEELLKKRFEEYAGNGGSGLGLEELIGKFDGEPTLIDRYTALENRALAGMAETMLFQVPTAKPWELVAYVPFGGWNDCPEVKEMMAVCKYWYEKYGAVPVTISHDEMEMHVPSPVPEKDALQAAKEHFAFTPDRVFQCTDTCTLTEVAASIAASEIWYFWWD